MVQDWRRLTIFIALMSSAAINTHAETDLEKKNADYVERLGRLRYLKEVISDPEFHRFISPDYYEFFKRYLQKIDITIPEELPIFWKQPGYSSPAGLAVYTSPNDKNFYEPIYIKITPDFFRGNPVLRNQGLYTMAHELGHHYGHTEASKGVKDPPMMPMPRNGVFTIDPKDMEWVADSYANTQILNASGLSKEEKQALLYAASQYWSMPENPHNTSHPSNKARREYVNYFAIQAGIDPKELSGKSTWNTFKDRLSNTWAKTKAKARSMVLRPTTATLQAQLLPSFQKIKTNPYVQRNVPYLQPSLPAAQKDVSWIRKYMPNVSKAIQTRFVQQAIQRQALADRQEKMLKNAPVPVEHLLSSDL